MIKTFCFLFSFSIFLSTAVYADPWGKDSDLVTEMQEIASENKENSSAISYLAELAIAFHQETISPADGPRSHFKPSSSQYTLEAIQKYGFLHGYFLGCDRLMRENSDPWVYRTIEYEDGFTWKYDPVD
jgi:uncharacterized protein